MGSSPQPASSGGALVRAHRIAEAVDTAWHAAHRAGGYEVPVSVLAALALRTPPDDAEERAWVARQLLAADDDQILAFLRASWAMYATTRPDLAHRVAPLAAPWFTEPGPDRDLLYAARRVVHAALRAGLHDLLAVARYDVDLFGPLLSLLRTKGARAARGQYYTPPDVADLLARLDDSTLQPGDVVWEPTAGTGGLIRAKASAIRDAGGDPRTLRWVAVDTDALALAALAVNAAIWDIGHILIAHADVTTDDWYDRALGERAETLALVRRVQAAKAGLDLLRRLGEDATDRP